MKYSKKTSNIINIICCYVIFLCAVNFMELYGTGRHVLAFLNLPVLIIHFGLLSANEKIEKRR